MIQVAILVLTILLSFVVATGLTIFVRRYAIDQGLLDKESDRSLHTGVVPRGGGLAIVTVALIVSALIWAFGSDPAEIRSIAALFMAIVGLGLIGWLDDQRLLATSVKFFLLFLLTILLVFLVGSVNDPELAGFSLQLGLLAPIVTGAWIFGLANSYNFMDGIDGLAATQAGVGACTLGIWFAMYGGHTLALFCYALMAACLGFLIWNWSPARIFMGDIGSLVLGGVFATLAVIGHEQYGIPIGAAVILFGLFIADTLATFIRRLAAGKKVWTAHREHYYQRAVQSGLKHHQVTIVMMGSGIVLSVLATLEALKVEPRYAWYLITAFILFLLQQYVIYSERRRSSH